MVDEKLHIDSRILFCTQQSKNSIFTSPISLNKWKELSSGPFFAKKVNLIVHSKISEKLIRSHRNLISGPLMKMKVMVLRFQIIKIY